MISRKPKLNCLFLWAWIGLCFVSLAGIPSFLPAEESSTGKIEFSLSPAPHGSTQTQGETLFQWRQVETKHTIIRYTRYDDLKKFDRKIDFSPGEFSIKSLFSTSDPGKDKDRFIKKIDALFERVQEILDMWKRTEKKVKIQLYAGKKELKKAYRKLFGSELNVRAWYVFQLNTIFINVDDVHEGMLAHEMAHSIIDNYLTVRPPRAAAEILAVYVDTHLFRKTKKYGRFK